MQTELKGYVEVQEDFKKTANGHILYVYEVRRKAIQTAYEKYTKRLSEYLELSPFRRKLRNFWIGDQGFSEQVLTYESFQEWQPDPWWYSPYKIASTKMQKSRDYAEKLSQDQFWKDTKKALIPLDIYTCIVENQP